MLSSTHITDKAYLNLTESELKSLMVELEEEPEDINGIRDEDIERITQRVVEITSEL